MLHNAGVLGMSGFDLNAVAGLAGGHFKWLLADGQGDMLRRGGADHPDCNSGVLGMRGFDLNAESGEWPCEGNLRWAVAMSGEAERVVVVRHGDGV